MGSREATIPLIEARTLYMFVRRYYNFYHVILTTQKHLYIGVSDTKKKKTKKSWTKYSHR